MTILPQEVWFADFPFIDDPTQSKDRPVIVLQVDEAGCRVLSMKITSRPPYSEFEIELADWAKIPLSHKSTADAASVRYITKDSFRKRIGQLSDADWETILMIYDFYLESTQ